MKWIELCYRPPLIINQRVHSSSPVSYRAENAVYSMPGENDRILNCRPILGLFTCITLRKQTWLTFQQYVLIIIGLLLNATIWPGVAQLPHLSQRTRARMCSLNTSSFCWNSESAATATKGLAASSSHFRESRRQWNYLFQALCIPMKCFWISSMSRSVAPLTWLCSMLLACASPLWSRLVLTSAF